MISVILPVKEEPYLPFLLDVLKKIENIEVLVQTGEGLGNIVRDGIERAKGEKIIVMDADGQHNPKYIKKIVEELDRFKMVICSRYVAGGGDERGLFRKFVSKTMTKIVKLKLNNGVKDPLSGYFGFRKELLDGIDLKCEGFKIGLEIIMKAKPKVREIQFVLEKRKLGKSKANFKEGFRLLKTVLR